MDIKNDNVRSRKLGGLLQYPGNSLRFSGSGIPYNTCMALEKFISIYPCLTPITGIFPDTEPFRRVLKHPGKVFRCDFFCRAVCCRIPFNGFLELSISDTSDNGTVHHLDAGPIKNKPVLLDSRFHIIVSNGSDHRYQLCRSV